MRRLLLCLLLGGCGPVTESEPEPEPTSPPEPELCDEWCATVVECVGDYPRCDDDCRMLVADPELARAAGLSLESMRCVAGAEGCEEVEECE